jgi:hypothetical protein
MPAYSLARTGFFCTITSAWKAASSISGQEAAVAVKTVATIISAAVTRLTRRSVRQRCHTIHDQLQMTTAMASFVSQPWA